MADIFLSYKAEDRPRVARLVAALRAAGLDTWWDQDIPPGGGWREAIVAELDTARLCVVAWSKSSTGEDGRYVREEAERAAGRGAYQGVVIDEVMPPFGFAEWQSIDLSGWRGRKADPAVARFVEQVKARLEGGAVASPMRGPRPASRGRLLRPIAAALVLLALALTAWLVLLPSPSVAERQKIAIIPFADLSAGGGNAYFAEGVAEEILNTLARDGRFAVLGRTSSWALRERAGDLEYIRGALGVGRLLEGSVRTAGDRIRVSVRLIDTSDGTELWTEAFDRRIGDVFAVQDEIARAVSVRVAGSLAPQETRAAARTSPQVYRDYLLARELVRTREQGGLERARALMLAATRADPAYAPAWAVLAQATSLLRQGVYGAIPPREAAAMAQAAARRALSLDPNLPEGHMALGIGATLDGNLPAAIASLERAAALDPQSPAIRHMLAGAYFGNADVNAAAREARRAIELDPLWRTPPLLLLVIQDAANDKAGLAATVARFRQISTNPMDVLQVEFVAAAESGDFARAIAALERLRRSGFQAAILHGYRRYPLAALHAADRIRADPALEAELGPLLGNYYAGRPDRVAAYAADPDRIVWTDSEQVRIVAWALVAGGRERELARLFAARLSGPGALTRGSGGALGTSSWWPSTASIIAYALAADGQGDQARRLRALARAGLERFQARGMAPSHHAITWAELYLGDGDRAAALRALEAGVAADWHDVCEGPVWIGGWPPLRPLRGVPRFEAVLARCRAAIDAQRRLAGMAPAVLP